MYYVRVHVVIVLCFGWVKGSTCDPLANGVLSFLPGVSVSITSPDQTPRNLILMCIVYRDVNMLQTIIFINLYMYIYVHGDSMYSTIMYMYMYSI